VGDYQADLWVADSVIVELKVARQYQSEDEAQLLNELKATGIRVGLLINFGRTKVEFKRLVFWAKPDRRPRGLAIGVLRSRWSTRATNTRDSEGDIRPRIEHGLNTDRMLTGEELVPVSYGNRGGPRSSSNGLSSEQFPTEGLTSRDDRRFCIRV
jgi:hypothetical protein